MGARVAARSAMGPSPLKTTAFWKICNEYAFCLCLSVHPFSNCTAHVDCLASLIFYIFFFLFQDIKMLNDAFPVFTLVLLSLSA